MPLGVVTSDSVGSTKAFKSDGRAAKHVMD